MQTAQVMEAPAPQTLVSHRHRFVAMRDYVASVMPTAVLHIPIPGA